ncbi:MAG: HIT family protein [Bacteroidetes bacterium]|nr:HIT family protein [Bacteroidota bacterium]
MPSLFTKIINGEIPCYKIAEDENNLAFLDIFPLKKGHVLVVPKLEVDQLFDLPEQNYLNLLAFSKKISITLKQIIPCNRISMHVVGLEVPHAHIHLIPINTINDCNFANEKLKFTNEEFKALADEISKKIKL